MTDAPARDTLLCVHFMNGRREFYEMLLSLIQTTWGEISWEEME